ncbi:MAG TPA: hypothetical protein VJA21_06410 [Verrucomicrobiae bacterium]
MMSADKEMELAALIILAATGLVIYRAVKWVMNAPRTADPWGPEVEGLANDDRAVPLCHHCFTPQEHNGWFCPECGCTVGPYCNYMPYVYIFSQGEVLRSGTMGSLRKGPLILAGYVLFSIAMFLEAAPFLLLAPVYWFLLFVNSKRTANTLDTAAEIGEGPI